METRNKVIYCQEKGENLVSFALKVAKDVIEKNISFHRNIEVEILDDDYDVSSFMELLEVLSDEIDYGCDEDEKYEDEDEDEEYEDEDEETEEEEHYFISYADLAKNLFNRHGYR